MVGMAKSNLLDIQQLKCIASVTSTKFIKITLKMTKYIYFLNEKYWSI